MNTYTESLDVKDREQTPGRPQGRSLAADNRVTLRAFVIGLFLAAILAGLNAWLQMQVGTHFLGGVQLPVGAIFSLLVLVLVVNGGLRYVHRVVKAISPFTAAELLTMYVMLLFAALLSTSGSDNFFLTTSPALFYFSSGENQWAELFYQYIPRHLAPGWDGKTYQAEVINSFYLGGVSFNAIPWHAWIVMLVAWGLLLLLVYATLFFLALLLRRQWIESEAINFPLIQLPLQMVEGDGGAVATGGFWSNRMMWAGCALAGFFHLLRGLNFYFPDWPKIGAFQGNAFLLRVPEAPWSAAGVIDIQFFFGAIGIAYLLTRELSFSFWFFFLLFKLELIASALVGYAPASLPKDTYLGRPLFISLQSAGGWMMMASLLLWTARGHFQMLWREAKNPRLRLPQYENEPFSARFAIAGFFVCCAGLMAWCWYAGINPLAAIVFFSLYILISLVLARLVVEGGVIFPQTTFAPLEMLTNSLMSTQMIGASSLTKLSLMQPMLFADMRANLLPGFLHTMKIAHDIRLGRRDTRRMLLAVACVVIVSLVVSTVVTLACIYDKGGLAGYTWYTKDGPQDVFKGTAVMIREQPGVQWFNWIWIGSGAGVVWLLAIARARFLWFPFHPLAFIISSGFPITQLWPSFFIGWLTKTLLLRYSGNKAVIQFRPFMIGLIFGNAIAMVFWMLFGFWRGVYIGYWPA